MKADFWHERWENGLIGFHQEEYNPYLVKYWPTLSLKYDDAVFVPMCGKSKDLLWLAEQGHAVKGVEVSSIAVESFFSENQLAYEEKPHTKFRVHQADKIELLQGDFFHLSAEDLTSVGAVFDRASLIALPPEMRQQYAIHLAKVLKPDTQVLLVSMEYPQAEMDGPPFSVMQDEVYDLYQQNFEIKVLEDYDVLAENPRFQDKGLTQLHEKVFCLVRK